MSVGSVAANSIGGNWQSSSVGGDVQLPPQAILTLLGNLKASELQKGSETPAELMFSLRNLDYEPQQNLA